MAGGESRGRVYRYLALLALLGCGAPITDVMYDPVSQTISNLAAGPSSWIADAGIILVALGILALAAGFVLWDDPMCAHGSCASA